MNIDLSKYELDEKDKREIEKLLYEISSLEHLSSDLEKMWYLIDYVWDILGCDNKNIDMDKLAKFYSHPVWILNGLFIEQDKVSMEHRNAVCNFIKKKELKNIVDYGAGAGTLAILLAKQNQNFRIDIYEPFPSEFLLKRVSTFKNIKIVKELGSEYDCLCAIDVLEHVIDPLSDFIKMVRSVRIGGYLIIANAFYPMIKCHLPRNFHFRYSFNIFGRFIGLEMVGSLDGTHASIYRKKDEIDIDWKKIRFFEKLSQLSFPFIELLRPFLKIIKKRLRK